MHTHTHHSPEASVRAGMTGLLLVLAFFVLRELWSSPILLLCGIVLSFCAVLLAKKVARHFHGVHTHVGDSAVDVVAPIVLFAANILHPAIDGFSFYETLLREGMLAGTILALGIVVHEVVRQSVLITAFRSIGIRWGWVIVTALLGIAGGIGLSVAGSSLLERHEGAIDVATLVAYVFIIAEFRFAGHGSEKRAKWFLLLGIALGVLLSLFFTAH